MPDPNSDQAGYTFWTAKYEGSGGPTTNYYLTQDESGKVVTDPQPLYQFEPQVISAVEPHLLDSYEAIAGAAPNAEIIVLGYPRLFPGDQNPSNPCAVNAATTVPVPDVQMLNTFGNDLDSTISEAVADAQATGINIHYINPNPGFSGHAICGSAPWINGIVNEETSNAGTSVPGLNSFHLMATGQQEYATLVNECLAGTLPPADGTC